MGQIITDDTFLRQTGKLKRMDSASCEGFSGDVVVSTAVISVFELVLTC